MLVGPGPAAWFAWHFAALHADPAPATQLPSFLNLQPFVFKPQVLFADEISTGLDSATTHDIVQVGAQTL